MNVKLDTDGRGGWVVRLIESCVETLDSMVAAAERIDAEVSGFWRPELANECGALPDDQRPRIVKVQSFYVIRELRLRFEPAERAGVALAGIRATVKHKAAAYKYEAKS